MTNGLTMGLSGVSTWGSDIGGFFALFENRLTPELLVRWIQVGAVSGVMRTQANGIGIPESERPQIWDPEILAHWRRWAKLRTQLYPYIAAADAEYGRSGLPIMRHLALAHPGDPQALSVEDAFMFGPDLLAAPVLTRARGRARFTFRAGVGRPLALGPLPPRRRRLASGARGCCTAAGPPRCRLRSTSCRCSRERARCCRFSPPTWTRSRATGTRAGGLAWRAGGRAHAARVPARPLVRLARGRRAADLDRAPRRVAAAAQRSEAAPLVG